MTPHEKAILEITRLGERLIEKGTEAEDMGLISIGLTLRLYMATAVHGDLEDFINHIHKFVEQKILSQLEKAENAQIGRAMQALKFVNDPMNLN
jgi:DNA-binding MarR family transcriptional regulator